MNTHKHARLTFARRLQMVRQMTEGGLSACEAAAEHGVTPPKARKWLGRYLAGGSSDLADASSRSMRSPRSIDPAKALLIVELRRRRIIADHSMVKERDDRTTAERKHWSASILAICLSVSALCLSFAALRSSSTG